MQTQCHGFVWHSVVRRLVWLVFPLLLAGPVSGQTTQSAEADQKNILFLYSYGHGSKGLAIFDESFVTILNAGGVDINHLFFEYLDLERGQTDPGYRARIRDLLLKKHAGRRIDLIVTGQQPALQFLLHEGRELADAFADVLFVLICLANQTGVDLTAAFEATMDKKTTRDRERHANNPKLR